MKIWFDGEIVELDNARISPVDRGLTVGDGVFETVRVYNGEPFALRRHIERLLRSAAALGLATETEPTLRDATEAVLSANNLGDARLRITITGGEGFPGSSRRDARSRTFLIATPFTPSTGMASVVIAPWTRNERSATAGLKTISYAANVRALAWAEARGASEALFANTVGNLCEATGSNVFLVRDGQLCTPPPTAGCLLGVTRSLILELAAELDIIHAEVDVPMTRLDEVSEMFLSSTTREVQTIAKLDEKTIAHAPGPYAIRLADAYRELIARTKDP